MSVRRRAEVGRQEGPRPAVEGSAGREGWRLNSVAVVGNPRTMSRTRVAAEVLLGLVGGGSLFDLAEPGMQAGLLAGRPAGELRLAVEGVAAADLVVFACPTYKAAYTGLLKCFLDLLPPGTLAGKLALPLMLGAGEGHRLTVEHTLKPVLGELGAACPPRGLYLLEAGVCLEPAGVATEPLAEMGRFLRSCGLGDDGVARRLCRGRLQEASDLKE